MKLWPKILIVQNGNRLHLVSGLVCELEQNLIGKNRFLYPDISLTRISNLPISLDRIKTVLYNIWRKYKKETNLLTHQKRRNIAIRNVFLSRAFNVAWARCFKSVWHFWKYEKWQLQKLDLINTCQAHKEFKHLRETGCKAHLTLGQNLIRMLSALVSRMVTAASVTGRALPRRSLATISDQLWRLGRLNHVAIATNDLDKATALYRDVMGAKVR